MDRLRELIIDGVANSTDYETVHSFANEALTLLAEAEEENVKRFGDCLNCEYRTVATAKMEKEGQLIQFYEDKLTAKDIILSELQAKTVGNYQGLTTLRQRVKEYFEAKSSCGEKFKGCRKYGTDECAKCTVDARECYVRFMREEKALRKAVE